MIIEYAGVNARDTIEGAADQVCALFRSAKFIALLLPLIIVWRLISSSSADPDLFARIAMGRLTLSHSSVPLVDPFAFTETLPRWVDHEWLSGVVFYVTAISFGDAGLIVLKILLASLTTIAIVKASALYQEEMPSRFVWTTVCALHAASAWTSTIRCQAFTYLFIALLYWAILHYRRHASALPLFLTPLLGAAWVNMHGGYVLGCIIIGLFLVHEISEKRFSKRLCALGIGWGIAPAITPYGMVVFVKYLTHALHMERPTITEWLPLYSDPESLVATLVLSLPLIVGLRTYLGRRDLFGITVILFASYCAFRHIRFLPFFMITAAIFGAPYAHAAHMKAVERWSGLTERLSRSGALAMTLMITLGGMQLIGMAFNPMSYRLRYDDYPVAAVEWLRGSGIRGRLLVDFNHGSFALWRLYPNFKVSMDGRYEETYPDRTVQDNAMALNPDRVGWREALDRINPTHILLTDRPNLEELAKSFGVEWRPIYHDRESLVLARGEFSPPGAIVAPPVSGVNPSDMWRAMF